MISRGSVLLPFLLSFVFAAGCDHTHPLDEHEHSHTHELLPHTHQTSDLSEQVQKLIGHSHLLAQHEHPHSHELVEHRHPIPDHNHDLVDHAHEIQPHEHEDEASTLYRELAGNYNLVQVDTISWLGDHTQLEPPDVEGDLVITTNQKITMTLGNDEFSIDIFYEIIPEKSLMATYREEKRIWVDDYLPYTWDGNTLTFTFLSTEDFEEVKWTWQRK